MSEPDTAFGELEQRLTRAGRVRLAALIDGGGLTPTEARPWLEPPPRDWPKVEWLVFRILDEREQDGRPLPWHLTRWLDRYRAERLTSLFD